MSTVNYFKLSTMFRKRALLPSSGKAPTLVSIGVAALQNFPISLVACVTNEELRTVLTYRGADKSLARPGRKQANVSIRMA